MSDNPAFVIVGGGLAGAKAVEALRGNDFDGQIILFSAEEHLPYERPPLSKDFLGGTKKLDEFTVDTAAWYRDHDVDLRLGASVEAVDPASHAVTLPDGSTAGYDKLLLATGSRSRHIALPGADAAGVHYLRTIDDAAALDDALSAGASLAIVGAGWIGLEVAASARQRGVAVTVVETAPLPLLAALGSEAAQVFADLHREHDVDLRLQTEVAAVATENGAARGLILGDGTVVAADAVLIAVGAQPNIELAQRAGLAIGDGGVVVDAGLRTSDPDIYAVGDIAAAYHPLLHTRIRIEHWANALKQPAVAAAGMLGIATEYSELPYFFTDQYDLGMEYVGYAPDYARVVFRGDPASREFIAFWLDTADRVLAGMNVNVWDVTDDVKALIGARQPVDVAALGDPSTPLSALVST
ncbi:Anthranilate 1,2-dioxygenase system ferredoxin--NAD(+) reductase component [uncultured Mycobacterium sp.]|uniref:Anthranilate 1,2-dioxygenase system ferredoxin--NAD(+) reductase component n=1 Tax=uncultured Mycobacterium sp. TaxID=171292 RepID=A0A1Y5PRF1_9MYCO|nr:Anthranilate 1,2-dioxygenase system ferredoxin--NAD(+) reductase component [uncultured Mycobacterium sp.]